jgi:hypothetical protein
MASKGQRERQPREVTSELVHIILIYWHENKENTVGRVQISSRIRHEELWERIKRLAHKDLGPYTEWEPFEGEALGTRKCTD